MEQRGQKSFPGTRKDDRARWPPISSSQTAQQPTLVERRLRSRDSWRHWRCFPAWQPGQ